MASIIDASDTVLGRLASVVAKRLLANENEKIIIVNAEHSVISGNPKVTIEKYKRRSKIRTKTNPLRGPFYPKTSSGIVRRSVRGMLPWKKPSGKNAMKRLKVFVGVPPEFSGQPIERFLDPKVSGKKIKRSRITVGEIASRIGGQSELERMRKVVELSNVK